MRRRVMMGKRELVEVVEELKSSGTWMVPAGCKFVDVFIVGGGGSGASSGPERGGGGAVGDPDRPFRFCTWRYGRIF